MHLKEYGLSRERGFISHYEIDQVILPPWFDAVVHAATELDALLKAGNIREPLGELPELDLDQWAKQAAEEQVRTAMVVYSFLAQAYVWGEPNPPTSLPANLAKPFVAVADRLGMAPIMPYSVYVLDNWKRLDKSGPIELGNIALHHSFTGDADEDWFVMVHVAIEAEGGVLLDNAARLIAVSKAQDEAEAERLLSEIDDAWERIHANFARMPSGCDPHAYFHKVRPYLHGWANNPSLEKGGLVYDGVERFAGQPQALIGQTGSQSSLVPAMDALFQINHSDDPLRLYLDKMHAYRPAQHRRFIEDIASRSTLRDFVAASSNTALKDAFNACLEQAARFRSRHLEYAASYIAKQAGAAAGNNPEIGTGGTPFMRYLKKHRDENRAQRV